MPKGHQYFKEADSNQIQGDIYSKKLHGMAMKLYNSLLAKFKILPCGQFLSPSHPPVDSGLH